VIDAVSGATDRLFGVTREAIDGVCASGLDARTEAK